MPPGGRRPGPLRDWIFSTSPPNMSERLPQAEVKRAPIRAQVALRYFRVPQLPPVVETNRTHRGADPDSTPRGIAHVGVSRAGTGDREDPPEGHVLGPLPDVPGVHEYRSPQDPEQRESCLDRAQEQYLATHEPRGIGPHSPIPDLVLEESPDRGRPPGEEAIFQRNPENLRDGIAAHRDRTERFRIAGLDPERQGETAKRDVGARAEAQLRKTSATFQYPSRDDHVPDKIAACFGIERIHPRVPFQGESDAPRGVALLLHSHQGRVARAVREDVTVLEGERAVSHQAQIAPERQRGAIRPERDDEKSLVSGLRLDDLLRVTTQARLDAGAQGPGLRKRGVHAPVSKGPLLYGPVHHHDPHPSPGRESDSLVPDVPVTPLRGEPELVQGAVPESRVDPRHPALAHGQHEVRLMGHRIDVAALEYHIAVETRVVDPLLALRELLSREDVPRMHRELPGHNPSPGGPQSLHGDPAHADDGAGVGLVHHRDARAVHAQAVADVHGGVA